MTASVTANPLNEGLPAVRDWTEATIGPYVTPAHHRAQHNAQRRTVYWQRRRRGLCVTCGRPVVDGHQACPTCLAYKAASQRRTYHERKEAQS